jgi:Fe-S-cluster containining protein
MEKQPDTRIDVTLESLESSLAGGLRFSNYLGASLQRDLREQKAALYALVELLAGKGAIHLHEYEARKLALNTSMQEGQPADPKVYLVDTPDKYAVANTPVIDCEARYHLCHGVCCKLWFSLSAQDLDERHVRWNYAQPYAIAQDADGRCVHQDRASFHCTVYEHRPYICRTYDCSTDKRIWLDFENRIPHPSVSHPDWPRAPKEEEPAAAETKS